MKIEQEPMSIHEAAKQLGITIGHAYVLLWRGSILAEKVNRKWQVDPVSVQNYADRRAVSDVEVVP